MPGYKRLMSLSVEYLGVPGVFGFPGVVALAVTSVATLRVPGKDLLWVSGKVVF